MSDYNTYQHYLHNGMSFTIQKKMLGYDLNNYDKNFNKIFYESIQIYKSLETLDLIHSLVSNVPDRSYFDDRNIFEDNYLRYHIENFYSSSISMLDKLAKLLNRLLKLKIKSKDCSFINLIRDKSDFLPLEIRDIVNQLNQDTKKLRKQRNYIIHEGEFIDDDWFMFSSLVFLSRKPEYPINAIQLASEVEKEFRKYANIIDIWNKSLSTSITDIFQYLTPLIREIAEMTINSSELEVIIHVKTELKKK